MAKHKAKKKVARKPKPKPTRTSGKVKSVKAWAVVCCDADNAIHHGGYGRLWVFTNSKDAHKDRRVFANYGKYSVAPVTITITPVRKGRK